MNKKIISSILFLGLMLTSIITLSSITYSAEETTDETNQDNPETREEKLERYNNYAFTSYIALIAIIILTIAITIVMISSNFKFQEYKGIIIWIILGTISMIIFLKLYN